MKHYLKSADDVIKTVDSNANGLSSSEATKRLTQNGKNKLIEAKKESMLHRFLKQLCEPMTIILLIATIVTFCIGILLILAGCFHGNVLKEVTGFKMIFIANNAKQIATIITVMMIVSIILLKFAAKIVLLIMKCVI